MSPVHSLHDVFLHGLYDLYDAEKQLTEALPKLAENASDAKLQKALREHLMETEEQVVRLEKVFQSLDESPKRIPCKGMMGLIEEGNEVMEDGGEDAAIDAALIFAGQKVEHYEISSYRSLCEYAKLMKHTEALKLLKETLQEEEHADTLLQKIAESSVNDAANDM